MMIYIDTDSGTWGVAENNLVIFYASNDELEWLDNGQTDSDIIELAVSHRE